MQRHFFYRLWFYRLVGVYVPEKVENERSGHRKKCLGDRESEDSEITLPYECSRNMPKKIRLKIEQDFHFVKKIPRVILHSV
jgi:hypothetical protein